MLEILAKAAREDKISSMNIRIGAREDMDEMITPPAIYQADEQTFHPFDFEVYEAIQKFNQHQNFYWLFAVIGSVYRQMNGVPLTGGGASLMQWLADNDIQDSALVLRRRPSLWIQSPLLMPRILPQWLTIMLL